LQTVAHPDVIYLVTMILGEMFKRLRVSAVMAEWGGLDDGRSRTMVDDQN
jgi:hypothetical protein